MKSHALLTYMLKRLSRYVIGSIILVFALILFHSGLTGGNVPLWGVFAGSLLMILSLSAAQECSSIGMIYGVARRTIWRVLMTTSLITTVYLTLITQVCLLGIARLLDDRPVAIFQHLAPSYWLVSTLLLGGAIWLTVSLTMFYMIGNNNHERPTWQIVTTGFISGVLLAGSLAITMMVIDWLLGMQTPVLIIFGILLGIQVSVIWVGAVKAPRIE